MTIVGVWTGQEATDLRAALRMPITEFSARTGIAERTISLWERKGAAVTPTPNMQQILDLTLELAPDSVKDRFALLCAQRRRGINAGSEDEDVVSDLNRRELLRLLAITAPALAMASGDPVDPERLTSTTADCSPALLAEYGKVNARLWHVYAQATPKRAVLPLVNEHLAVITSRLRDAREAPRQKLCVLASDLFQLSGEIFFDQNRYTDAAHCYTLAADAAREGRSADLWACALTRHSFVYVYGHEFPGAVPMLEAATSIARKGDRSLSTWQWASCVRAQALAGLGNSAGSQRALDDAETVTALPGPVHNDGWLRFDGSRLPEEQGSCYTMLGRPDLATASLEAALTRDLSPRRRGSVHTDLAATGLQRRDLDQFAAHATTALQLAGETGSGYVSRRLKDLHPQLDAFAGDQRVRDIADRIGSLEVEQ
jgi:transcriptional regulator with XRE-family HTH domain